eukprot:gene9534-12842_t
MSNPISLPNRLKFNMNNCVDVASVGNISTEKKNPIKKLLTALGALLLCPILLGGSMAVNADDELAKYAAEGNTVGVDGQCFMRKCALETSKCANDPTCLKGLSCLARCKGGSMCSTGCFAKYGSERLDGLLSCSVEKNDCVHVPGKSVTGWTVDTMKDLPVKPLREFNTASLEGTWYKVMGLDSRYDCFDCQKNSFEQKDSSTLKMEALFRIPRPTNPGYFQNKIVEELHATSAEAKNKDHHISHMQSKGEMFGLTFWENWYILAESKPSNILGLGIPSALAGEDGSADLKLVYYTGHTLQGSYKGAFLYSRSSEMTPGLKKAAFDVIRKAGLNPNDFCIVKNQCFLSKDNSKSSDNGKTVKNIKNKINNKIQTFQMSDADTILNEEEAPYWYLGQKFYQVTNSVANELADWFEDPTIVSDWLVNQQERMAVSPFASLTDSQPK